MSKLLTTKQALQVLSLNNYRILNYLQKRYLLTRIELGPRTFRYELDDCLALIEKVKKKGISLTAKP